MPADAFQAAISLHGQGRLREAERLYEAVLKADPEHFDTLHHLGVLRAQRGKVDDAIRLIRRALETNRQSAEALLDLGVVLEGANRHAEAIPCYEKALALKPDYFEASFNLGNALQALGRHDEAIPRFENALALQPMHAVAHDNLGISLHEIGRHPDAIRHFERALAIAPRNPAARNNLGTALQTLGRHTEATAQFERAISLKPDYAQAHYNLGNSLYALDRFTESIECNQRAIALKPDYAKAHNNLGTSLSALGRNRDAIQHFEKAFKLDPAYADAHWNESLAHLALGRFEAGWKTFEWRWLTLFQRRDFQQPLWLGEQDLSGKTILLHAEQGLGDTLQFCRYASVVRDRGAQVILEVQPELVELLRNSLAGPSLTVLARNEEDLPPFDLQCPLMSLPLAFGTVLETVPDAVPYLRVDATRCARWATWLGDVAPPGPRVGLVWAGSPRVRRIDTRRSVSLATFRPFFEIGGVAFVSLQKDEAAAQVASAGLQILDPTSELRSFADTAALVANLDLVVTVDTSVAHLAGGLGKPVWMLSRFDGCWRWLLDREDSPWYPTMRIFRQPAPYAWEPVIKRVAGELSRFAAGDRPVHRPLW